MRVEKLKAYMTSLRLRILMIVLLCWLLPALLLGGYMGGVLFDALQQKTEAALTESAGHAQTLTIAAVQRAVTQAKDVTYDGELATAYQAYAQQRYDYTEFYRVSRNYLERKYGRDTLFAFAAYFPISEPDKLMYTVSGYSQALSFQRDFQKDALSLGETLSTRCAFAGWGGDLYLVRNLYNLRMERYGMLILGINRAQLFKPLNDAGAKWGAAVDIHLGGFESNPEQPVDWLTEPEGLSEKAENLSCVQRYSEWDFSLYTRYQVSKAEVYRQMTLFRRLLAVLILAIVPIGILIMWFVQKRIARPIAILSQASKRISAGELGVTVPMRGSDELGQLGVAFSSMSTQIRRLVDTVYKEQLALKDARIEAMQARVNPHFLNNALELITWQARLDGSEAVTAMVEALSVLLNAGLDRGDHRLAPIAQELEVADAYFYFIRLRFGDKLTLWKDADPALHSLTVPRLVIQTLLENAVEHGIAPAGGGAIHLKVFRDECNLHIEVVNSGKLLTEEDREKIQRLLSDEGAEGHVGIRNVSLRLRLIYGEKASLAITSDNRTHDTVASILIPLNVDGDIPALAPGVRGPQPPIE
jgi:two-component system sensor histidine kinase YesM